MTYCCDPVFYICEVKSLFRILYHMFLGIGSACRFCEWWGLTNLLEELIGDSSPPLREERAVLCIKNLYYPRTAVDKVS